MTSVRSPDALGSRDPFELDRLAEELAAREASGAHKQLNGADDFVEEARDLPLYVPLSHNDPYLSAETFDVEQFLLSRAYTSLPDLRSELRDYLATLKEELVKLINDDYEAFISLSTDLRGEGTRLESMKRPLGDLKSRVLVRRLYSIGLLAVIYAASWQDARKTLQVIQDEIKEKLDRRAVIREEKAFLHLLLKISESITRLESLLLISSPDDAETDPTNVGAIPLQSRADGDPEDR